MARPSRVIKLYKFETKTDLIPIFFLAVALSSFLVWSIAGYFSVLINSYTREVVFMTERRSILENLALYFTGFNVLFFLFFPIIIRNKSLPKPSLLLLFLIAVVFLMTILSGHVKFMLFYGIFVAYILFNYIPSKRFSKFFISVRFEFLFILVFSIWVLIPVLIVGVKYALTASPYFTGWHYQLYFSDGIRGFALDNVQYGFGAGLLLTYLLIIKCKSLVLTMLAISAVLLSNSNAVFVAFFLSSMYLFMGKSSLVIKILILFLSIFPLVALVFFINFNDPRLELFLLVYEEFLSDPIRMIFIGNMQFFSTVNVVHQPHNFLLQTMLNFGVITAILFVVLLFRFFMSLSHESRATLIYVYMFGAFHAGFSIFLYTPVTLLGFAFVFLVNFRKSNRLSKAF